MRCPNLALIFITFCLLFVFGFGTDEDVVTSPPLADTSIQAPISTKTNVSRTAPDVSLAYKFPFFELECFQEILKQSIQAKVKKLRQLKLEARQLSSQLRRERRIKAADGISKEERVMKLQKWKSRMRKRVKALIKRVNRLEQVMKIRKAELQSVKRKQHQLISTTVMPVGVAVIPQRKNKSHKGLGKKGHKQPPTTLAPAVLTTLASTSATITTSTIPSTAHSQTPVLTTQKSKTISKRSHIGVDGNPCETHKDCAPGHWYVYLKWSIINNGAISVAIDSVLFMELMLPFAFGTTPKKVVIVSTLVPAWDPSNVSKPKILGHIPRWVTPCWPAPQLTVFFFRSRPTVAA